MRYCKRCIMPDTKPDIYFDSEGICSACRNFERRSEIDWGTKAKELEIILDRYRGKNGANYDCIVPVSGGKDSHYQTLKMLKYGMRPLCVTASTDHLSDLGRQNIENLKNQGVDYIEYIPNPVLRRKIAKFALETVGDISYCEHSSIFATPFRVATAMKIPLLIYGESSQSEYGGPPGSEKKNELDLSWREEFGGLLGLRTTDISEWLQVEEKALLPYTFSPMQEIKATEVRAIFLGQYLPWDGWENAKYSYAHGFQTFGGDPPDILPRVKSPVEGQISNYENLDNYWTGIHDYFKFLKFGFGRATDIACMWIRRGRMKRENAILMVRERERFPWTYLGYSIANILEELNMTMAEFVSICDQFTNPKIFRMNGLRFLKMEDGTPIMKEDLC